MMLSDPKLRPILAVVHDLAAWSAPGHKTATISSSRVVRIRDDLLVTASHSGAPSVS